MTTRLPRDTVVPLNAQGRPETHPLIDFYKIDKHTKLANLREEALKTKLFELDERRAELGLNEMIVLYEMQYPLRSWEPYGPDFTTNMVTDDGRAVVFNPHFIETWTSGRIKPRERRLYAFRNDWQKDVYIVMIVGQSGFDRDEAYALADELWFMPNGQNGSEQEMRTVIDEKMERFVSERCARRPGNAAFLRLLGKIGERNQRRRKVVCMVTKW